MLSATIQNAVKAIPPTSLCRTAQSEQFNPCDCGSRAGGLKGRGSDRAEEHLCVSWRRQTMLFVLESAGALVLPARLVAPDMKGTRQGMFPRRSDSALASQLADSTDWAEHIELPAFSPCFRWSLQTQENCERCGCRNFSRRVNYRNNARASGEIGRRASFRS